VPPAPGGRGAAPCWSCGHRRVLAEPEDGLDPRVLEEGFPERLLHEDLVQQVLDGPGVEPEARAVLLTLCW
jgi:hypothetical protein